MVRRGRVAGGRALAQTTLVHYAAIHTVVPSFVLLVVVWYAMRVNARPRRALRPDRRALRGRALAADRRGVDDLDRAVAVFGQLLSRGFFADSIPFATTIVVVRYAACARSSSGSSWR